MITQYELDELYKRVTELEAENSRLEQHSKLILNGGKDWQDYALQLYEENKQLKEERKKLASQVFDLVCAANNVLIYALRLPNSINNHLQTAIKSVKGFTDEYR